MLTNTKGSSMSMARCISSRGLYLASADVPPTNPPIDSAKGASETRGEDVQEGPRDETSSQKGHVSRACNERWPAMTHRRESRT